MSLGGLGPPYAFATHGLTRTDSISVRWATALQLTNKRVDIMARSWSTVNSWVALGPTEASKPCPPKPPPTHTLRYGEQVLVLLRSVAALHGLHPAAYAAAFAQAFSAEGFTGYRDVSTKASHIEHSPFASTCASV